MSLEDSESKPPGMQETYNGKFVSQSGDRWNQIYESLLITYRKLVNLGFSYYQGKVIIIDTTEA